MWSMTVYLHQVGRGLRLRDNNDRLTILDFVTTQHRDFRLAPRVRSGGADPNSGQERDLEPGPTALLHGDRVPRLHNTIKYSTVH